jgi:hypothetical protein
MSEFGATIFTGAIAHLPSPVDRGHTRPAAASSRCLLTSVPRMKATAFAMVPIRSWCFFARRSLYSCSPLQL